MLNRSTFLVTASLVIVLFFSQPAFSQDLEGDWNDFLHYTAIGRFDLAAGFAENIVASDPDPIELLTLSEENTNGYRILLKMNANNSELRQISGEILDIIEQGRYLKRTDARIIVAEIQRLSTTIRGRIAAEARLKNAGEFAIPYMLDALLDFDRKDEYANVAMALPKVGKDAIRPLVTALQIDDAAVKAEIIRALGDIGYPQSLGHLKYVVEQDASPELRMLAQEAIEKIDGSAMAVPASELLFNLGRSYYFHNESLTPSAEIDYANVWFWDTASRRLEREEVSKSYFNELMAMRSCEWSLKADENTGKSIALWLAAFFKAESAGVAQPEYFGVAHADAKAYARTAGPEYLQQALDMAIKEGNAHVVLGLVEALAANAGESSLMYRVGIEQPLVNALSFNDVSVRYSAAIAIGMASPSANFVGSELVVKNLASAIAPASAQQLDAGVADEYARRAVIAMSYLGVRENQVINLAKAMPALIEATKDSRGGIQMLAAQVLAHLNSSDAQKAIVVSALNDDNAIGVRVQAFKSLATSAKKNANLLNESQVDAIYAFVGSNDTDPELRSAAAGAYGALNLPSKKVKNLILDQAVN